MCSSCHPTNNILFFVANAPNHIPGLSRKPMVDPHRSKRVPVKTCVSVTCLRYLSVMLATSLYQSWTTQIPMQHMQKSCPLDYSWSVLRYMRPIVPEGRVHGHEHMYLRKSCIKQRLMAMCRCGMPNFFSSFFDSTISEHTNPFSILPPSSSSIADSRIGEVIAMSSPVANTRTSNPKRLQTHNLTVIVTNCRSLVNKKAELINLLDSTKADIAICTETWLNSTISDSEICPDNYSLFRNDRTDRHSEQSWDPTKCSLYRGVHPRGLPRF